MSSGSISAPRAAAPGRRASLRALTVTGASLLLPACYNDRVEPCGASSGIVAPSVFATSTTPPSPPSGVVISPQTYTLAPGERATFIALATGFPIPECRPYALTIGWSVADTAIARVERDTGDTTVVLARAPGTTTVIATVIAQPTARAASLLNVVAPTAQGGAKPHAPAQPGR